MVDNFSLLESSKNVKVTAGMEGICCRLMFGTATTKTLEKRLQYVYTYKD